MKIKNIITVLAFALLPLSAYAWGVVVSSGGVAAAGGGISEDFTGCSDWTNISQTLSCSDGVAHGTNWETNTVAYNNTQVGSNNHWVAATVLIDATGYDSSGVIVGSNGTEYYYTDFQAGTFYIRDNGNDWNTSYAGTYGAGSHTVAVQIDTDGSNHARFNVWIDGTQRITDASDTGDNVTRGQYVGVRIDRSGGADVTVDNLTAGQGSYTP